MNLKELIQILTFEAPWPPSFMVIGVVIHRPSSRALPFHVDLDYQMHMQYRWSATMNKTTKIYIARAAKWEICSTQLCFSYLIETNYILGKASARWARRESLQPSRQFRTVTNRDIRGCQCTRETASAARGNGKLIGKLCECTYR